MKRIMSLLLSIIVLLSACGQKEEETGGASQVQQGVEQVEEQAELPVTRLAGEDTGLPNPFRHLTRGPGMSKMQILYDSLLESGEDGYIPWLASSWSVDESAKVFSFNLVEHALWHDGTPLTVEDVIFSFEYYQQHIPVVDNLTVSGENIVEKVEKTSEYSFAITVKQVDNNNLGRLGGVRILPKHIWENIEDPINYVAKDATIGSGPFVMTHYDSVKGEYRYEAFTSYWGLKPAVKAIEWIPVSDNILAFDNGEIDLINASADALDRYKSDSLYTVLSLPSYHSYRLMMNMETVEALGQVSIRQALAYGINREALIQKVARGSGTISSMGYVPDTSDWYNEDIENYEFSSEKAKELLKGQKYRFTLLVGNTSAEVKLAELIQLDLADIGIEVLIESVESKTRDQAIKTGNYELLLVNSGGMGGDPDYLRSIYGSNYNNSPALSAATVKGYYNEELFRLAEEQALEVNEENRGEIIDKMQEIIAEEVPMILLYSQTDNFIYRHDDYDGWFARWDHSKVDHNKLSYVK